MNTILQQKLSLLQEILRITQAEPPFTGLPDAMDDESTRLADLYNKRARLMKQIKQLDQQLEATRPDKDAEPLLQSIKQTSQDILKWDQANTAAGAALLSHVKKGMKELRLGKEASMRYHTEITLGEGFHFDKRN